MLDPATFVAGMLGEFTKLYPDTSVQILHRTFEDLRRLLRSGELDFMIGVLKPPADDMENEPLFTDDYVVAVRAGHPLADRDDLTLDDLLEFDWIIPNHGAPRRLAFENLFAPAGRIPKTGIECHSLATIRATLYESDRITILTQMDVDTDERAGLLKALPVGRLHPAPVIGLTTRRDWLPTSRQKEFLDLLRRAGRAKNAQPVRKVREFATAAAG